MVPFNGGTGAEFASELEGVLGSITIDEKQYFTLIDRTTLDKVMAELKLSASGMIDPAQAVKIGKLIGAEGIYSGTISRSFTPGSYQERRQECSRYEQYRDKQGNLQQGQCIQWRRWNVNCTKNTINLSCSPKLIHVSTGRIVYARDLTAKAEDAKCEDIGVPRGESELAEMAKTRIKYEFRKDVAPFYETRLVKLMDSTDGITSKDAEKKLKAGVEYAGKKRLDMACELWGQAASMESNSAAISYNLGVCAESRADVEAAYTLYRKADVLLGKPDDEITAALGRTQEAIRNFRNLREEMITIQPEQPKVPQAVNRLNVTK